MFGTMSSSQTDPAIELNSQLPVQARLNHSIHINHASKQSRSDRRSGLLLRSALVIKTGSQWIVWVLLEQYWFTSLLVKITLTLTGQKWADCVEKTSLESGQLYNKLFLLLMKSYSIWLLWNLPQSTEEDGKKETRARANYCIMGTQRLRIHRELRGFLCGAPSTLSR